MKLPIYDIALIDDVDQMLCVSFVEHPAVEREFMAFNDTPRQSFQAIDTDEHKILGVAIRCGVPIYRGEYYVRFTKEVIEQIVEKYSEKGLWNTISLQHSGENLGGAILTQYFIKDSSKGICPAGFEDVEDYSLFLEFKITDEELWNEVKYGKANGFSIEIISSFTPTDEYIEEEHFSDLLAWFEKVTRGDVEDALSQNRQVDLKIGERTLTNQQLYQLGRYENKDVVLTYDPSHKDWTYWELDMIDDIILTDNELENFEFNSKWKMLTGDERVVIRTTRPTSQRGKNSLDYIFDRNLYVMISYNDETDSPATGYRTCFLSSHGYTTAGNECIRIYEYNGDTKSGFTDGRWRLLLTRRIMDLKAVDYADTIKTAPVEYNGERQRDTGRNGTMTHIKRIAEFPSKIVD